MHIVELPEYGMEEPEYGMAISIVLEYQNYYCRITILECCYTQFLLY